MTYDQTDKDFIPGYQRLRRSGELAERIRQAYERLSCCTLCPRQCRVNRYHGERGYCGAGDCVKIARFLPHFGEEPPLIGMQGAGTIFFSHCSLKCCYCQNYQISHQSLGQETTVVALARIMCELQEQGCANIDLVTPTQYLPFILDAVRLAAENGLIIPLVYNSSGYESLETLHLLDDIVDIFLPDWKYSTSDLAEELSHAPDYPSVCEEAVREMYYQVGDLVEDPNGLARRGRIVRHLVLPGSLDNTERILRRIAELFPDSIRVSLMSQYVPCYQSELHPGLDRPLTESEYGRAREVLEECGLAECWIQELESRCLFLPDFTKEDPFGDTSSRVEG